MIATLSEPYYARTWWPCKDVPGDKATLTIEIDVPDTLMAVSQGNLVDVVAEGDGRLTYRWRESYPVATYLVSMAVTDYAFFGTTYTGPEGSSFPITHYVYPEDSVAAAEDFSPLADMLDQQISLFGQALELYQADNGTYPSTDQGLQALVEKPSSEPAPQNYMEGGYLKKRTIPKDPWGRDYVYVCPGQHGNDFEIMSFGADGQEGGEGENADVKSWE